MFSPNDRDSRYRLSVNFLNIQFRRRVWDSRISVQVNVSGDEILSILSKPSTKNDKIPEVNIQNLKSRPFFIAIPRSSYLPLFLTQLRRHYDDVFTAMEVALDQVTPWFEFNGIPLSWHYPLGHLFDEMNIWSITGVEEKKPNIPWQLTLHFTNYPSTLLPSYSWMAEEGGGPIGMHFYSMLKQADFIRNGSGKGVMNLGKSDQMQLWDGLWTHSFDKYWRVYDKVLGSEDNAASWKGIPIKLYFPSQNYASSIREIIQFPINPALQLTVNDLIISASKELNSTFSFDSVHIHGIKIDFETPLIWLAMYFTFPDGFIHLILSTNNKTE